MLPPCQISTEELASEEELTTYELASAIASAGCEVELRGEISVIDLASVTEAAGVHLSLPTTERPVLASDTIVVPSSWDAVLPYVGILLSSARTIVCLARPSHRWERMLHPEVRELSPEIWSPSRSMGDGAVGVGLTYAWIGVGRPGSYPDLVDKSYGVVWDAARDPSSTKPLIEEIGRTSLSIGRVPAMEKIRLLAAGKVLIWPWPLDSPHRLPLDAAAMGTVLVALEGSSVEGPWADGGAVLVPRLDDIPGAVRELLADTERLEEMAAAASQASRRYTAWPAYVSRVERELRRERSAPRTVVEDSVLPDSFLRWTRGMVAELNETRRELAWMREESEAFRKRRAIRFAERLADVAAPLVRWKRSRRGPRSLGR